MYDTSLTAGHTDRIHDWEWAYYVVNTPDIVSLRWSGDDDNRYIDSKLSFVYNTLDYYFSIGKLSRLPN